MSITPAAQKIYGLCFVNQALRGIAPASSKLHTLGGFTAKRDFGQSTSIGSAVKTVFQLVLLKVTETSSEKPVVIR